uniref:Lebercilin LCA5 n=1 Tax=Pelodiscus sinensis TaxID=13735 RepID=K7FTX6_PELSI|nr:lebercilin isoform X1 [Pelodiscus sinensis]|eukprot:XP_006132010.1 lebercilin isoform X1 [Pelodiscus sinensis]
MGERTRSLDSDHDRTSDGDKNSNSYYSDEDNASDPSLTLSSQSTSHGKKDHKTQTLSSLVNYQATKKPVSKYAPAKRGTRWGFRSQSLNRDSPAKDIDLVTKRVLSARLLKINELRNELTELHIKLDELQKENRALKRLQYRQEKALNKFEDTENEISQLLARHNNEIRILRERLRKSQERERTTERRLKDSEDELYRTKNSLQKLKKLSAHKHLAERDELAKKLASTENSLDESEKRIKDLEKNLELNNSSFQRQLQSEKKKVHEALEENKALQEELQQLNQKLKEKERELDTKNIYANRMLKPSPKKDTDLAQRKKATNQNIKKGIQTTKGVQTSGYVSPIEFPPPPEFVSVYVTEEKEEEILLRIEQETQKKAWKEQAEHLKNERNREREEKLKRDQELQILEEKAQKLCDEWKKEEFDRRKKDNNFLLAEETTRIESEIHKTENEIHSTEKLKEERQKKEMLLAKMHEIDRETQNTISMKLSSQAHLTDTASKSDSVEKNEKTYQFLETEKLLNGFPGYDNHDAITKAEVQTQQNVRITDSNSDLTFGSYVPSFGKGSGRPSWLNQKSFVLEENSKENTDFKKEKKSNLMEQLFGTSANTILPSKSSDTSTLEADFDSSSALPLDKSKKVKVKDDGFFGEGRNFNPNRHHLQHTRSRPAVKAVDSFEDEIEEVIL